MESNKQPLTLPQFLKEKGEEEKEVEEEKEEKEQTYFLLLPSDYEERCRSWNSTAK